MQGSRRRIENLFAGQKPDRIPLFDLIANDAVLEYFNGGKSVAIGDDESAILSLVNALDATRLTYFSPMADKVETLASGQTRKTERWTLWTSHREYASSDEYCAAKRRYMEDFRIDINKPFKLENDPFYARQININNLFGKDFCFLLYSPSPGLMDIYSEVGLEAFSYYLCDCEDVIINFIEHNTNRVCQWAKNLPEDGPFGMVFIADDIAFNHGPMVSPVWLKKHYFPNLRRVVKAYHDRGKKVMFHSDGNLNVIMDDLVETGIDALNPIEVAAGMNIRDLHRRYPNLIFAGGIDVSNLLPFGTPDEVRDAVINAIDDSEGKILVGSSTEVINSVPLENYLAMRQAVLDYKL